MAENLGAALAFLLGSFFFFFLQIPYQGIDVANALEHLREAFTKHSYNYTKNQNITMGHMLYYEAFLFIKLTAVQTHLSRGAICIFV